MSKLSFLKAPVSLIAGLVLSVSASANLIQNGSFENGDYSQQNYSWVTVDNGQSNITGWDIGGVAVDWHNSAEFSPIQDGLRAVDLNLNGGSGQTGTLSQTFATDAGTSYILDFYFAGPNTNFPNARQVQVDIAGSTAIFDQIASPNRDLVWGMHSLSFTAIDASTTLTFSSVDSAGYWGAVIDDVSVKVPEPASRCDFNRDGNCNLTDMNRLFAQGDLTTGTVAGAAPYDLDNNRKLDQTDIDLWLDLSAETNGYGSIGSGRNYRRGDTDGLGTKSPAHRDVDITDFNALADHFDDTGDGNPNNGPFWNQGNFDGDDDIDITDFNFLASNFAAAGYAGSLTVPEPSSLVLSALGLLAMIGWIFSRQRR